MRSLFSLLYLGFLTKPHSSLAQYPDGSKHHREVEAPFQIDPPIPLPLVESKSSSVGVHIDESTLPSPSSPTIFEPKLPTLSAVSNPISAPLFPNQNSSISTPAKIEVEPAPKQLFMGYYPDWAGPASSPEKVDWRRYDWVDFAFALPTSNYQITWDDPEGAPNLLKRVVDAAHASNCKVKLSIGGWSGSKFFSLAVATPQNRQTFATNILAIYNSYELDGIDLDWEYPGHEGDSGNVVDPQDSGKLLLFLKLLRESLPPAARITAAAQTLPFVDSQGNPSSNMSDFASILDWVLLMNYDTWGSSTNPGPNAPLHDGCGNSSQPGANAVAAYNAWINSGFPAFKLVLGLPSYGYVSASHAEKLRTRSSLKSHHARRRNEDKAKRIVKVVGEDGDSDSQVQFRDLVKQGILVLSTPAEQADGMPMFVGSNGFERRWDVCSETPFLRSADAGQIVTYDDPDSLAMKAAFVKQVGMLGTNMFDIHGDTDEYHLADSIRKALGL